MQSGRMMIEKVENLMKGGLMKKPLWYDSIKRVSIFLSKVWLSYFDAYFGFYSTRPLPYRIGHRPRKKSSSLNISSKRSTTREILIGIWSH